MPAPFAVCRHKCFCAHIWYGRLHIYLFDNDVIVIIESGVIMKNNFNKFVILNMLCSLSLFAAEQEYGTGGLSAEKLATFAYPDYPLDEALTLLHDEVYADPATYDSVVSFYARDLSNRIKALGLPQSEQAEILAAPYNEQESYLNMKVREQQGRSRNAALLTGTTYRDVDLFWDTVPARQTLPSFKVIGEVDALSLNNTNIRFDLDKVTRGPERLILSRFTICNIDSTVSSPCTREGYTMFQPIPINRTEMFSAAQNDRQNALPKPPSSTGTMNPSQARGLYEAARHYQTRNPGTDLMFSIVTDFKKVAYKDIPALAVAIKDYASKWGYAGVFFDNPAALEGDTTVYYELLEQLRSQSPELVIGVNLFNSHQLEDWDIPSVQELVEKADFYRIVMNRAVAADKLGQPDPLQSTSDYHTNQKTTYVALFQKLSQLQLPVNKAVAFIQNTWNASFYDSLTLPSATCGSGGCGYTALSGIVNTNVSGPGTLSDNIVYHYDLQHQLKNADSYFNVSKKYDNDTFTNFYLDQSKKLILTGNDASGAFDKAFYAAGVHTHGVSVRLEHDNGENMRSIIEAINQQGMEVLLTNQPPLANSNNEDKYVIIPDVMFSVRDGFLRKPSFSSDFFNHASNEAMITVYNEREEAHTLKVSRSIFDNIRGEWVTPYGKMTGNWRHIRYTSDMDYRDDASSDAKIAILSTLPPGRYRTRAPLVLYWAAHHEAHYWKDFTPTYRTVFINVDVTF